MIVLLPILFGKMWIKRDSLEITFYERLKVSPVIYIKLLIENSKAVETQGSIVRTVGKSENPGGSSNVVGKIYPPVQIWVN